MVLPIDFQVEWQGSEEATSIEILRHIIERPTKNHLPKMVLITGKSGTGKSSFCLNILDNFYSKKNIDFSKYINESVVIEPTEFGEKVQNIFTDDKCKKLWLLQIDEARFIVGADNWNSFYNHAVGHIRAASRAIKPIALFVVTQFSMDIDKKTRSSPDYIFDCTRTQGKATKIVPHVVYVDEKDRNAPKIKTRRLFGLIKHNGQIVAKGFPTFHAKLPRAKVKDIYDNEQVPKKMRVLQKIIKKLLDKMKLEFGSEDARKQLEELLKHFTSNKEELKNWAQFKRKKWRLKPDVALKLGLSRQDCDWLEDKLTKFDDSTVFVQGGMDGTENQEKA